MVTTNYLWDGENYLEEYDEFGTSTNSYTYEPFKYGKIVSQNKNSQSSFFHYDVQGSTQKVTNDLEVETDRFLYDAWGNEVLKTGSTEIAFRYIGEIGYFFDEIIDSYYVRARHFTPATSRWNSHDPLGHKVSSNLYEYALNNPTSYIDPTGLIVVCCRPAETGNALQDFFFNHCQLRNRCPPGETSSPVWVDSSNNFRKGPNGNCCSKITKEEVEKCVNVDNKQSNRPHGGRPFDNNNCQSNTVDRLARCCLSSTWIPNWYAHPAGRCVEWAATVHAHVCVSREYSDKPWRCKSVPDVNPTIDPVLLPLDDTTGGGWPRGVDTFPPIPVEDYPGYPEGIPDEWLPNPAIPEESRPD